MKILHDSNLMKDCFVFSLLTLCFLKVTSFSSKKTAAEKAYVSALCRILVLLHFRISEQGPIKCMRKLLHHVVECVSSEKELLKELKRMSERLRTVDSLPDKELLQDDVNLILGISLIFSSDMFKRNSVFGSDF